MVNAGKYAHKIGIYATTVVTDSEGFHTEQTTLVLEPWAYIKTTKGMTLIKQGTDFEKAYTNFTIRFPKTVEINRDMLVFFRNKWYTIEYINNVDEANVELELQCKEVKH